MNPMDIPDENHSNSFKIPTSSELYDFFNTFILKWLKIPSQKVHNIDDSIQILPNENSLLFSHPMSGILVLRTSEDFGKALMKMGNLKEISHDLFLEMIVLFWHRFVSHFWEMDSRNFPAGLIKKSLPKHWPDRKADSQLIVFVLQQPIEISFWFHLTPSEIERWKKPTK